MIQLSFDGIIRRKDLADTAIKTGSGVESIYYQMTADKGIKIIRQPFHSNDRGNRFETEQELHRSDVWSRVKAQFETMKYFHSIERGPEVFEMLSVYDEGHKSYYPAIIMEHINYTPVQHFSGTPEGRRIMRGYERFCNKLGQMVGNTDAHTENVVFDAKANRFKIIDFGALDPMLASMEGRERMKQLYVERQAIRKRDSERINQFHVGHQHKGIFIAFSIRLMPDAIMPLVWKKEEEPLPDAGLERVKAMKRRHREFIDKFVPKRGDIHSRKFKNAA